MNPSSLFTGFEAVSSERWLAELTESLGGLPPDSLNTHTLEDIPVKAFYRREDTLDLPVYPPLSFPVWQAGLLQREGSPVRSQLQTLAREYQLAAELNVSDTFPWPSSKTSIVTYSPMDTHGTGTAEVELRLSDPFGTLLRQGYWDESFWEIADRAIESDGPSLWIDLDAYAEAGAHRVQELGFGAAHLAAQLDRYAGRLEGRPPAQVYFHTSLAGDFFLDIAKVRAIRWLAGTIFKAFHLPCVTRILVRPGLRNKTVYDYNNNLLRSALECMAGIIGGADQVFNLPYDIWFKSPHLFSERLAITQLLVLKHEAHLHEGGELTDHMYYTDYLTSSLADKALKTLRRIQSEGGILAASLNAVPQNEVLETANKQQERYDLGDQVLLGSNYQLNKAERLWDDVEPDYRMRLLEPDSAESGEGVLPRLTQRRWAASWEAKRLQAEFNNGQ